MLFKHTNFFFLFFFLSNLSFNVSVFSMWFLYTHSNISNMSWMLSLIFPFFFIDVRMLSPSHFVYVQHMHCNVCSYAHVVVSIYNSIFYCCWTLVEVKEKKKKNNNNEIIWTQRGETKQFLLYLTQYSDTMISHYPTYLLCYLFHR